MKRIKFVVAIVSVLIISLLTACDGINKENVYSPVLSRGLIEFEDGGVLYVNVSSYCVTPYYSPNGKLCHYVDGEIVEIE